MCSIKPLLRRSNFLLMESCKMYFLVLVSMLFSSCYGIEYFAVNTSISFINQTCYRQGHTFQPCNTLENYSSMFHNNGDINITIYLLDNLYTISRDSYFSFTAPLIAIRPWNRDSSAILNCINHHLYIHSYDVEIFLVQSVQFLHCGNSNHPVILFTRGNKISKSVQIINASFIKSRQTSLQILSYVVRMNVINSTFTKAETDVAIFITSDVISDTVFSNVSFTLNSASSLLYQGNSMFIFNVMFENCKFINNTSNGSQPNIVLSSLYNVTILSSLFMGNSPNGAVQMKSIERITITNSSFLGNSAESGAALHVLCEDVNSRSCTSSIDVSNTSFSKNNATFGGALYINGTSEIQIHNCVFHTNLALNKGGSLFIYLIDNYGSITRCLFEQNLVTSGNGGAIFILNSHIEVNECKFNSNTAIQGGAIFASLGRYRFFRSLIINNRAEMNGAGLQIHGTVEMIGTILMNNTALAGQGGAINASGDLNVTSSEFIRNSARNGGALWKLRGESFILYTNFTENVAKKGDGGAIVNSDNGIILLQNCKFYKNEASSGNGGALQIVADTFNVYQTTFILNSAENGGAIDIVIGLEIYFYNCDFSNNYAYSSGGAIRAEDAYNYTLTNTLFHSNSAISGAGIDLAGSKIAVINCRFIENIAMQNGKDTASKTAGGAIRVTSTDLVILHTRFVTNEARYGGAIRIDKTSRAFIGGSYFSNNTANTVGGAVSITNEKQVFIHGCSFLKNSAYEGGAVNLESVSRSQMTCNITDDTRIDCFSSTNSVSSLIECLEVLFSHDSQYGVDIINCTFSNNVVDSSRSKGGAISVQGLTSVVDFEYSGHRCNWVMITDCIYIGNIAINNGGGIHSCGSTLVVKNSTFQKNTAQLKGGGIWMTRSNVFFGGYINFSNNKALLDHSEGGAVYVESRVEECRENSCPLLWSDDTKLNFEENMASSGSILYGGMLDRCSYLPGDSVVTALKRSIGTDQMPKIKSYSITSPKIRLCFCSSCKFREMNILVYPGQRYNVSLACVDQLSQPLNNCVVKSDYLSTTDVQLGQGETKREIMGCKNLTFHALPEHTGFAILKIESDIICMNKIWSTLLVNVTIDICPLGFQLIDRICGCDKRLADNFNGGIVCDINIGSIILQHRGWFSYKKYLRIHNNCPLDYCHEGTKYISLAEPDSQCANNRGGILCGGCVANYSVVLGSWKCMDCSHLSRYNFIWLTVLLALAGVVLVVFLLVVKMTVSSGTTNGLIFYANILSFSGLLNYRTCSLNPVLRVFLSWINLDLGIEVCYYSGMDVYQKTWLQFIFPFYIWFLVGVIILFCHYSSRVMKLMGMRNIEILATLFLLSYAKLLKTIVTTFSFTDIMVAQAENVSDPLLPTRVWVYDGSIKYLGNKHLPLFTVALLFLIFLFLPYTILLIIGQYIYLFPDTKYFKVFRSTLVTTVMDAYHAPYNKKFRFWTGLSLLIRCLLFSIFAVSHAVETNLFYISIFVVFLFSVRMFAGSTVYQNKVVDCLEIFNLLNLLALMITFFKYQSCDSLTASITISAITFGFTVIMHVMKEMKKSNFFNKFIAKVITLKRVKSKAPVAVSDPSNIKEPSVSYVELRETLIGP